MTLESLITAANRQGASDLHLEPGLPAAVRVRGALKTAGEPLTGKMLLDMAHDILGNESWAHFLTQRSADFSRTLGGVRCRINIMHTSRGVGFAIRLLASFQATIDRLNLHPDLKKLVTPTHGLVIVSGPTGSGKSSTLAALIQEINLTESRLVLTLESPIEHIFRARRAFIRQREVGRDTPSFAQGLLDALREDPDVLMVGEMREPETMRLTLNAAETGHLVFATVHSGSCAEALQRIVLAFPAEIQSNVAAQLADSLVAVVCQRLRFRQDLSIRVPECEILRSTSSVKTFIRNRDFFKLPQALETGADHGMWSFDRYQTWMARRTQWHIPSPEDEAPDQEEASLVPEATPVAPVSSKPAMSSPAAGAPTTETKPPGGRIEIEPEEGGLDEVIKRLS
ncbi:MAG TPA: PilT/PilU family type 4a pilus ATPase [Verrucomicrobiae bacterium]|nr:PilT/PilU family type 4a pilus ATPase [Verrucomicrobiae bacterium]